MIVPMRPEAVLADLVGLRALARSLVGGEADDLLHDTAVLALEHPPVLDERPVGGWLRTLLRNRWRMDHRGATRRRAREHAVAALRSADPAADEALASRQTLDALAAALDGLEEPFRSIVTRRYLEGQNASEIAHALGVPAGTVRWRLKTGLARLRVALDAPPVPPPTRWQRAVAPLIGASLKTKTVLVIAIVWALLFGVLAWWWLHRTPAPSVLTAITTAARAPISPPPRSHADPAPRPPWPTRATVEASDAPGGVLTGRLISGATRDGIAGAEITFLAHAGATAVVTDADGGFTLASPVPASFVVAAAAAPGFLPYASDPQLAPVRVVLAQGRAVTGVSLVLWPAIDVVGRVVDRHGTPAPGARIQMLGAPGSDQVTERAANELIADASGQFTFQAAPGTVLEATRGTSAGRAVFDPSGPQLRIELRDHPWLTETIAGHVRGPDGQPVADVRVAAVATPNYGGAGPQPTMYAVSDDDGGFAISGLDRGRYQLTAEHEDHAVTTLADVAGGSHDVQITVERGVVLAGRVVDPSGAPVPTFSLAISRPGALAAPLRRTLVDPHGRFALRVVRGDYQIAVSAPGWAAADPARVTAGTAELRLALRAGSALHGNVVASDDHRPIAAARVRCDNCGGGGSSIQPANLGAATRPDGSFELAGLPAGPGAVWIEAEGYHPRREVLTPAVDGGALGPITFELTRVDDGDYPSTERVGIGVTLAADGETARVWSVVDGGSAQAAGIVPGDHIAAVDGIAVRTLGDLRERLDGMTGTSVALTVLHEGKTVERVVPRRTYRSWR